MEVSLYNGMRESFGWADTDYFYLISSTLRET
jgi:hypothetical protein